MKFQVQSLSKLNTFDLSLVAHLTESTTMGLVVKIFTLAVMNVMVKMTMNLLKWLF